MSKFSTTEVLLVRSERVKDRGMAIARRSQVCECRGPSWKERLRKVWTLSLTPVRTIPHRQSSFITFPMAFSSRQTPALSEYKFGTGCCALQSPCPEILAFAACFPCPASFAVMIFHWVQEGLCFPKASLWF